MTLLDSGVISMIDLKTFGYAPGNYMITCISCGDTPIDCDKRAICCKPCAEDLANKKEALEYFWKDF